MTALLAQVRGRGPAPGLSGCLYMVCVRRGTAVLRYRLINKVGRTSVVLPVVIFYKMYIFLTRQSAPICIK